MAESSIIILNILMIALKFSLVQVKAGSEESSLLPDSILKACTEPGVNLDDHLETGGCYIDSDVETYPNNCFGEHAILNIWNIF